MLEASQTENIAKEKIDFINSLKISSSKQQKTNIEVPTCIGDGLGIQPKISF